MSDAPPPPPNGQPTVPPPPVNPAAGPPDGATDGLDIQVQKLNQALSAERKRAAEAEAERDEERKKHQSEAEKALSKAADDARKERDGWWKERLLSAEVRAAAASKLADPDDARLADLDGVSFDDEGVPSRKDIDAAIDSLVKLKPHLAAKAPSGVTRAPAGTRTEGAPNQGADDWLRGSVRR